jgi:hypothetical protein
MIIQRKLPLPQYFLDANRVNAKGKLPAMNQLEKWHADGVISLMFPEPAQNEAEASGNARRTRKAREYWASVTAITTDEERECLRKIERIIFGDEPLSPQDKNDALNVSQPENTLRFLSPPTENYSKPLLSCVANSTASLMS